MSGSATPTSSPRLSFWASVGFVPLWSSAVIFGALALRHGPPFAVTAARFGVATVILAILAVLFRAPWPRGMPLVHAAMTGLLLQGESHGGGASSQQKG